MIFTQEHHGPVAEQHLVIDVIGQPVDPGLGATVGLPGAEAEIRIPVDYVVEGVVIPPQHPDHRVGILLVDGHGQLAQEAGAEGGLHHQAEAGPLGDRLAVEGSDAVRQQEPGLELLLQGQGELGRLQPLTHPHQEGIVKPVPQLGERLAHRRGGDAELLGRPCHAALLHQVLEDHQQVQIQFTQVAHLSSPLIPATALRAARAMVAAL